MCKALVHKKQEDCLSGSGEKNRLEYFKTYNSTHGLGLTEICNSDLRLLFTILKRLIFDNKEIEKLERIFKKAQPVSLI